MRRRLGQHFLKDARSLEEIADALSIEAEDRIIEIGPGHGELTARLLARKPAHVVAIERDSKLAETVRATFRGARGFSVIEGEAVELLPKVARELLAARGLDAEAQTNAKKSGYKIAGNIPYYITGRLLRTIGDLPAKPENAVFLVQREVAERICAKPPRMNLLAATVQIWAEARTAHIVKRNNFSPPPQVDSAILALELTPRISAKKLASYFAFVRALFKQPRKTILNNLVESGGFAKDSTVKLVEKIGLNPGARPQELDVALILKLLAQTEKLSEE